MGYYTDYTLNIYGGTSNKDGSFTTTTQLPEIVVKDLEQEIEKMGVFDRSGSVEYGYYSNSKWYDHDDDMLLLSKRFPEVLFCLHGEGEEQEDMWENYYYNGKLQECPAVIKYDDFDFSKLVDMNVQDSTDKRYSYQINP